MPSGPCPALPPTSDTCTCTGSAGTFQLDCLTRAIAQATQQPVIWRVSAGARRMPHTHVPSPGSVRQRSCRAVGRPPLPAPRWLRHAALAHGIPLYVCCACLQPEEIFTEEVGAHLVWQRQARSGRPVMVSAGHAPNQLCYRLGRRPYSVGPSCPNYRVRVWEAGGQGRVARPG